ncbi:integrase catalytic subunit [Ahrensia sp. R2A130]|nr:integrase catalytic subunit [Ahrensia sp. R2A130]
MQRFRSIETLQKFASIHASVHNHFDQQHHLISRHHFNSSRDVALD